MTQQTADEWNEEIKTRLQDHAAGKAKTYSWEEVEQRISAKLNLGLKIPPERS